MKTTIKPLSDRIIVKQKAEATMTAGGLYIPSTSQDKPLEGEVLSSGPGRVLPSGELVPNTVKAGDQVLFPEHSYAKVKLDGEDVLIIREENILGVLVYSN